MTMNYLTLGGIIRNEQHYVQEWLTFHYVQGFERFVIVLHKCADQTEARIKALPFADKIHVHKVIGDSQHVQMSTYAWIAETYGKSTEWLAIIDSDEFLFGTDTDDFRTVLTPYENFGGLFVNWLEYGHNNHIDRPKELCIEAFTKRAAGDSWWHASGKSIVKPKELLRPYAPTSSDGQLGYSFLSPHLFKTAKPTVHTDFVPVSYRHFWRSEHISHDWVRCNHYRYRSWEDWLNKCNRGNPCDARKDDIREIGYAVTEWQDGGNHGIEDAIACRFATKIKEILK